MRLQHVGEAEALATHLAGVWLLAGVCPPVALHVGPAGEALPADLADKRLLSCPETSSAETKETEAHGNRW